MSTERPTASRDRECRPWEPHSNSTPPTPRPREGSNASSTTGDAVKRNREGRRYIEETHPQRTQVQETSPCPNGSEESSSGIPAPLRPRDQRTRTETLCHSDKYPPSMMEQVFGGPLHHLPSAPPRLMFTGNANQRRPSIPMEDQRHPGKPDAKYHSSTRNIDPATIFQAEKENEAIQTLSNSPSVPKSADVPELAEEDATAFVTGIPLACLIVGLMLAVFLISIDRTIISTAIPYITSEFRSTPDIGWYGSAYLLTACAFQPVFGRVFTLFSVKKSYLLAMFLFELGSLLCGVAPTSMTLIVGRAIAGLGCAGILTGSFVVVATAVPLHCRPIFMAVVGLMFGVGASIGPLLGGVFTDLVTWRWCFYINLPVGGAAVAALVFFFHPKKHQQSERRFTDRVMDLDIVGNILLLGASIMLFLALELTTQGMAWSSSEITGLLAGCGLVSIVFAVWQCWKGDDALMPPRILQQRTVSASCGMAFMTYGAIINLTFFLPVWFQAIKDDSAIASGVNMIPYFAVNSVFSLVAGAFVSSIGYVTPPAVIGSAIGTIGLGLMTMLNVNTTTAQWVGYEILASAGFGLSIQQGFTAVQTVLDPADMAVGTAAVVASQSLGGAIFLSVGNSVLQNELLKAYRDNILSDMDIKKVIDGGAASFRHLVSADGLYLLLEVYNGALQKVFIVGIPLGALAAVISCFIEFKSVKKGKPNYDDQGESS